MRKLAIFCILAFFCYAAKAQYVVPRGLPYYDTRYINYKSPQGFILIDSLLMLRNGGDTLMKPLYPAVKYIHDFDGDSTLWLWDLTRWKKLVSSGGGGSGGYNTVTQLDDSTYTINRFDGTKDTIQYQVDTSCSGSGSSHTITLTAGDNIEITGDPTQAVDANPVWTISSPAQQWKSPFAATFGAAGAVTLSSTLYFQVTGRASGFITDETTVQFVATEDAVINHLFVSTSGTQPASGSMVVTLRLNGGSTALTVTIPANSSTGTYSDVTHSVTISAGDLIDWQVVNNATSAGQTILSIGASQTGSF